MVRRVASEIRSSLAWTDKQSFLADLFWKCSLGVLLLVVLINILVLPVTTI